MDKTFETDFIDRTGRISKRWGLGEPEGRVLGAIYLSEKPISQKEIAEMTGYSLSLVSPCLKIIESQGLVKKARGATKEKTYESSIGLTDTFRLFIRSFLDTDIKPLIQELEKEKKAGGKNRKIEQIIGDYRKLEFFFGMYEKVSGMKKNTIGKLRTIIEKGE